MAALAKVVAASRAEPPPPPPSPKGGTLADLSATEKRRVAKLVQQLLAVEKAHQGAQARWRAGACAGPTGATTSALRSSA